MTRRWVVTAALAFGTLAGSAGGFAAWCSNLRLAAAVDPDPVAEATDPDEVLETAVYIQTRRRSFARGVAAADDWMDREAAAALAHDDQLRLGRLVEMGPESFRHSEKSALPACRAVLLQERDDLFAKVRELWEGRETLCDQWLLLDADYLRLTGRSAEARRLLKGRPLTGLDEARRLARLALLSADDPAAAWRLLEQADRLAPGDSELRLLRGRLLLAVGRGSDACDHFAAALAERPDDELLRDQLAESLRRQGRTPEALSVWLKPGRVVPDFVWLKTNFWSRVANPARFDWTDQLPSSGGLRSLALYIDNLPRDAYWCDESTRRYGLLPGVMVRQDVFWLRLLEALRNRRDLEAVALLHSHPTLDHSWQPDLERALARIVAYRADRSLATDLPPATSSPTHPFFEQVEKLAQGRRLFKQSPDVPEDLADLLASPEADAAALLAAGWTAAAVRLHNPDADLDRLPAWYRAGITAAVAASRTDVVRIP
jgi:hypothetical protein